MDVPKESNNDLRNNAKLFEITDFRVKPIKAIALESNNEQEFSLNFFEAGQNKKLVRLTGKQLKEIDKQLVDGFFHLSYVLSSDVKGKCKKLVSITMRGEDQLICEGELDKLKFIEDLIAKINQY
jgi:hypothetical protein